MAVECRVNNHLLINKLWRAGEIQPAFLLFGGRFSCNSLNSTHTGNPAAIATKRKPEKLVTFGEALRKLRRLDEQYERMHDYFNRWRAEYIGKLIESRQKKQAGLTDRKMGQ